MNIKNKPLNKFEYFFSKYFAFILFILMLIAFYPIDYDYTISISELNNIFWWSAFISSIIVILSIILFMPNFRKIYKDENNIWIYAFLIIILMILFIENVCIIINAKIGSQKNTTLNGIVLRKFINQGKHAYPKYNLILNIKNLGKKEFVTSKYIYDKVKLGQKIKITFKEGFCNIKYIDKITSLK